MNKMDEIVNIIDIFGLEFNEPLPTVMATFGMLLMTLVLINYFFKVLGLVKEHLSVFFNLIIFIGLSTVLILVGINQNNELIENSKEENKFKVLTFDTLKQKYAFNEKIGVKLKFNRTSYFYLFSETKKRMIQPNNSKDVNSAVHRVEANETINLQDIFSVQDNYGEKYEKLLLLASTNKIPEFEALLIDKTETYPFSSDIDIKKYLQPSGTSTLTYGDDSQIRFTSGELKIHITNFSLVIENLENVYRKQEDVYIDTVSSANGYVTIFEGTAQNLHRVKGDSVRSDEKFKSQVRASSPVAEHIIVAIYSSEDKSLTTNDFNVIVKEKKGGKDYTLKFKDESYPYTIKSYMVRK